MGCYTRFFTRLAGAAVLPVAALSAASITSPSHGSVTLSINGGPPITLEGSGNSAGLEAIGYGGNWSDSAGDFSVSWGYDVATDPQSIATILGNTSITNTSGATAEFDFVLTAPLCPTIPVESLMGAYVSINLAMGAGGGLMTCVDGAPAWATLADNEDAASLFDAPFALGSSGAGLASTTNSFGTPFPNAPGPAVDESTGVRLRFSLTDGATATINTSLFVGTGSGDFDDCDQPGLPGDANGDGVVDVEDLLILLSQWGRCEGCSADFTGNGIVGVSDLIILLGAWH